MAYRYRTTLRPAHGGGMPSGCKWTYVERPSDPQFAINRPDLPMSKHRFGVVETEEPISPRTMEHFDIVEA